VVVDESVEAIRYSVPKVPNERAVLKESTMLFEELVPEPVLESQGLPAEQPPPENVLIPIGGSNQ